jgi:hypothetical protein
LSPKNGLLLDVYRYDNLDFFLHLTRQIKIKESE